MSDGSDGAHTGVSRRCNLVDATWCDLCGSATAWCPEPEVEGEGSDCLAAPCPRGCPHYPHRWYRCRECPLMDFCGACVPKHAHACYEGPAHDMEETCVMCMATTTTTDLGTATASPPSWLDDFREYMVFPEPPPRPHPDHPAADPEHFIQFYQRNPGPHFADSEDSDNGDSDDDSAYCAWYPGPYKDAAGKQRRAEWSGRSRGVVSRRCMLLSFLSHAVPPPVSDYSPPVRHTAQTLG